MRSRSLLLAALSLLLLACTRSGSDAPATRPDDFAVRYEWRAGSMPPPYHYEYTVTIGGDGQGEVIFVPDYPGPDIPEWREPFTLDGAQMDALYETLRESGAFRTAWRATDDPPIGGSVEWLVIEGDGRTVEIPPFVVDSQSAAYARAAAAVRDAVPAELWASLEARRQAYEESYGE